MKKWKLIDFSKIDGKAVYKVPREQVSDFLRHFDEKNTKKLGETPITPDVIDSFSNSNVTKIDELVSPEYFETFCLYKVEDEYYWSNGTILMCETYEEMVKIASFYTEVLHYVDDGRIVHYAKVAIPLDERYIVVRDDLKKIYLAKSSILIRSEAKVIFYDDWVRETKERTVYSSVKDLGIL